MSFLSYIVLFYLIVIAMLAACIVQVLLVRKVLKVLHSIKFLLNNVENERHGVPLQYTGGEIVEEKIEPYKIINKREPTDKIEDDV